MSHFLTAPDLVRAIGAWTHRQGPRYSQLADALSDAIAAGTVEPGMRLPAERALASELSISRGTVVAAYAALAERGLVRRRQGSGTTVSGERPAVGRHLRYETFDRQVSGPVVPLDMALASPLPDGLAASLAGDVGRALALGSPDHGYAPLGLHALRAGVAARLSAAGTPTTPDQILITAGAQGALALLIGAFVRAGDRVVVESPTYAGLIELLSRAGAVVDAIPRDHAGPRPDLLARAVADPEPAMALLVPTCHNPTGTTMSLKRRHEILAAAAGRDFMLVEDLTLSELQFEGQAPAHMVSLAPERVVAIGSFSKVLWGGLRTGWIRADKATILRLARLKIARDMGCGILDQVACVQALPRMDEIAQARRTAARRARDILLAALAEQLPSWEPQPCTGGYSLWVRLPTASAAQVVSAALHHGVAITGGQAGTADERNLDYVRLCFVLPDDLIPEAVRRLRAAWDQVMGAGDAMGLVAAV